MLKSGTYMYLEWSQHTQHLVTYNYKVLHLESYRKRDFFLILWETLLRVSLYSLDLSWATPAKPWHLIVVFAQLTWQHCWTQSFREVPVS